MRPQAADTPLDIEEMMLERYRRMTPVEKWLEISRLIQIAEEAELEHIRAQYGTNLSKREERLRLAALWLDRETMVKVFDWDPEVKAC